MRARGDWSKSVASLLPSKSSQVDDPSQRPPYGPLALSSRRPHTKPNVVQASYLSSKGANGRGPFSPQNGQPRLPGRARDEAKVYSFLPGENASFNLWREHGTSQSPVYTDAQDNERSCSQSPLMKNFSSSQSCIKVHSQYNHLSPVLTHGKLSQSHADNHIDELENIYSNSNKNTPLQLDKHVQKIQIENEDSHQTAEHQVVHMAPDACARLYVDGPFSSPSEDMIRYPVVVGIAGGVGITPLAATLTHILHHPASWPKRVHMIWVMRDARLILTMAHLLSSLLHQSWQDCNEDRLEFCFHVTTPISHEALQELFGDRHPTLIPRIKQGRPQWKSLFHQYSQAYKKTKVGVFACGPKKLCQEVKRLCLRSVTQGAPFAYHQESFS